jgi:hypothetical protein
MAVDRMAMGNVSVLAGFFQTDTRPFSENTQFLTELELLLHPAERVAWLM